MSKKNFSKGIDAFFDNKKPIKEKESDENQNEKRTTFIIEADILEKLKALAYWERTTAKMILKQSLEHFFESKGNTYIENAVNHYRSQNSKD